MEVLVYNVSCGEAFKVSQAISYLKVESFVANCIEFRR